MQNTLFLSFFCPKENIIQISYQKSSRAEVRSEYASEILNLFTYCKKTVFLFFLFLPLLFELNQVSCMGNQKTVPLIHFYPKWTYIVCRKYSSIFMDIFLFDIELTFLHFTGYCLRAVSEWISQCRVSFLHLCSIFLW